MIRKLTPQERWELSQHTDTDALLEAFRESLGDQLPQWLYDGLAERIEKQERMIDWAAPVSDRRQR